jgi:hypothetical protein
MTNNIRGARYVENHPIKRRSTIVVLPPTAWTPGYAAIVEDHTQDHAILAEAIYQLAISGQLETLE